MIPTAEGQLTSGVDADVEDVSRARRRVGLVPLHCQDRAIVALGVDPEFDRALGRAGVLPIVPRREGLAEPAARRDRDGLLQVREAGDVLYGTADVLGKGGSVEVIQEDRVGVRRVLPSTAH